MHCPSIVILVSRRLRVLSTEKMSSADDIISINTFTSLPRIFFKVIGILSVSNNGFLKFRTNLLYHITFWNLGTSILGELVNFTRWFMGMEHFSFLQITYLILCVGYLSMCFAKVLSLLFQSESMHNLLVDLQAIHPMTKQDQERCYTKKYYAEARRVMTLYACVQMLMIWCFNLSPLAESLMVYWSTGRWEVDLPYPVYYPFYAYSTGLFEFLFIIQLWAAFIGATGILAVDMFLCGIVIQICMHFDDVKRKMTEFIPTGNFRRDMDVMKEYIAKHAEVMRYVPTRSPTTNQMFQWMYDIHRISQNLNDIFTITILFNFVSSCVIICMMAFLSMVSERLSQIIKYAYTAVTCILQIFIVGWLGDRFIASVCRTTISYHSATKHPIQFYFRNRRALR